MKNLRTRSMLALSILVLLTVLTIYSLRNSFSSTFGQVPEIVKIPSEASDIDKLQEEPTEDDSSVPQPPKQEPEKHVIADHPTYKPEQVSKLPPIVDNFPLAALAHSEAELPPIPPWNKPPSPHVPEKTPLFIGFTRNWRLLQQAIVSYVTAGWPPEDIYVVENTGTMKSNELGLLSLQNPFFLNHTRLRMFGVNIVATPTLLSFSQLQNFYIWMAIQNNFTTYFYGHMDVIVLPYEDRYTPQSSNGKSTEVYTGFKSIYELAVDALRLAISPEPDPNSSNSSKPWAARFFSYDRLALVNREAYESIGGWDTAIPYYNSDCDMHDRLKMYGFEYNGPDIEIGNFCDVAGSLDNLLVLYRKKGSVEASWDFDGPTQEELEKEKETENNTRDLEREREKELKKPMSKRNLTSIWNSDNIGSDSYKQLFTVADGMAKRKNREGGGWRNTWQARQTGGKGDPYYRDPGGFEKAIEMLTQAGRNIYAEKWGHQACDLLPFGRKAGDEWRVEHDWER